MSIKKIIASFVLAGLAATSCVPTYVANTRNVPMFDEAKEFTANVSYFSGIDAQVAYSFSDHIAAMANGNVIIKKTGFPLAYIPRSPNHLFGEGGIGYFTKRNDLHLEIFGGYGVGQGYGNDPRVLFFVEDPWIAVKGRYNRIFAQPSISFGRDNSTFIVTSRFSAVSFSSFVTDVDSLNASIRPQPKGYRVFFEPALTWRFDLANHFKGYVQLGLNVPLRSVTYYSNVFQLAAGIQFRGHSRKDGN